ncbi:MAG: hypothetical protein ACK4GQ_04880, partial [Candidatus Hadarchaeales archaeon]
RAIAENLVGIETVIPGEALRQEVAKTLNYLRPANTAIILTLLHDNTSWVQRSPENETLAGQIFIFSGKITIVVAEAGENRIVQVPATLALLQR